jgi:hypothetical protein
MPISMAQARRLCSQRELELVDASSPRNIRELSPARLKQKVTRARALRDKYRDLAKRQRLEARGKKRPQSRRPAQGNENTVRKAELFDEVLERFQSRVETVGDDGAGKQRTAKKRAAEQSTATKRGGAKKSTAKKSTARKGAARKSAARKGAARKSAAKTGPQAQEMAEPGTPGAAALKGARRRTAGAGRSDKMNQAIDRKRAAHTRSAGRRNQSKRDRR